MLGGGLEPPCLAAYAPQTYVSAISPPERVRRVNGKSEKVPRKCCLVSELFFRTNTRAHARARDRNRKETRAITSRSTSTITSMTETCFHGCDAFRIRPSNLRVGRL